MRGDVCDRAQSEGKVWVRRSLHCQLGSGRLQGRRCRAIALDPKDNTAYDNRALNHEKLGETAEAIADYQKVLTIVPSDQYAKDALKRLGASAAAPGGR
jgi:tetratricopeptide (TPR) repeat protein